MEKNIRDNDDVIGTLYGVAAFGTWGVLPVYWKLLRSIPAVEILAHRILWAFVFVGLLLLVRGQWPILTQILSSKNHRIVLIVNTGLITVNWFLFIWAVNANHIVEASMGYYITPLVNMLLGFLVLRERMNFWQYVSVALAAFGVLMMTIQYGKIPWIALILSATFSTYGLLKKIVHIDSLAGLGIETLLIAPCCPISPEARCTGVCAWGRRGRGGWTCGVLSSTTVRFWPGARIGRFRL